jgi:hypothetical protein
MQERNCQNKDCGKPLSRRQKKYCSTACQWKGRRSPKADKIWALKLENPKRTLVEIANAVGADLKYVDLVLYSYASRPKGLVRRIYKPRKPKEKPSPPKEPEPLPAGKYGKHVAPGWLWRSGEELEKKYEHLGQRRVKKKK